MKKDMHRALYISSYIDTLYETGDISLDTDEDQDAMAERDRPAGLRRIVSDLICTTKLVFGFYVAITYLPRICQRIGTTARNLNVPEPIAHCERTLGNRQCILGHNQQRVGNSHMATAAAEQLLGLCCIVVQIGNLGSTPRCD